MPGDKAAVAVISNLLDLRLAFVGPLGIAVLKKLLQDWKAYFAIVQRVAKIAALINPSCWNPRKRQTDKLFDVIFAARSGIGQNRHVWLIDKVKFFQHGSAVLAAVPDGNKIKMHPRIVLHYFEPAAVFQFSLAIRAPGRPQMHDA